MRESGVNFNGDLGIDGLEIGHSMRIEIFDEEDEIGHGGEELKLTLRSHDIGTQKHETVMLNVMI